MNDGDDVEHSIVTKVGTAQRAAESGIVLWCALADLWSGKREISGC